MYGSLVQAVCRPDTSVTVRPETWVTVWTHALGRDRCDERAPSIRDGAAEAQVFVQEGDAVSTDVWATLTRIFREYGMPAAIRVDNGQPWAAPKVSLPRFGGQVDYAACLIRAALSNSPGLKYPSVECLRSWL